MGADYSAVFYLLIAIVIVVLLTLVVRVAWEKYVETEERQNPPETPIGTTIGKLCQYADTRTGSAKSFYTATGEVGYRNRDIFTREMFSARLVECFQPDTCIEADASGNCLESWSGTVSLEFAETCQFGSENFGGLSGKIICSQGEDCSGNLMGNYEVEVKTILGDYSVTALPDFCIWFRPVDSTSGLVGAT